MKQTVSDSRNMIEAQVQVFLVKEGRYWVAVSPALRVTGYGKTEQEAMDSFKAEMDLFFEEAHEKGTLATLLIQYGWTLSNKFAVPPITEIPVELLSKKSAINTSYRQVAIPV